MGNFVNTMGLGGLRIGDAYSEWKLLSAVTTMYRFLFLKFETCLQMPTRRSEQPEMEVQ